MVSQGWLTPVTLQVGPGYRATDEAVRRLADTADRVYRRGTPAWDGRWRLAFVDAPRDRSARTRLRAELGFLGLAEYAPGVWVTPWPRDVRPAVERAGGSLRTAVAETFEVDPAGAWDLPSLGSAYADWAAAADRLVDTELRRHEDEDEAMFAARFHLVHEWRKFLFADPGLPTDLLPERWPGRVAEDLFHDEATRLEPGRRGSSCAAWPGEPRRTAGWIVMSDPVLLDVSDGVATITFNRPDAMNSLDVATKVALLDAVRRSPTTRRPGASC